MIDIHTHILPEIDDGSKSVNQTLEMIEEAYWAGFTDIITTSHYIEDTYDIDKDDRDAIIENIAPLIEYKINLHNGAEAYISPDIVELYRDGIVPTLADSQYVLFELPMNSEVIYEENIIKNLKWNGYIPIIAHPERYASVKRNINKAFEFIEMGALLQCNYGSFIGKYGDDAYDTAINLLKKDKITFLGTDCHRTQSIYPEVDRALKVIKKNSNDKMVEKLTTTNPQMILNNISI